MANNLKQIKIEPVKLRAARERWGYTLSEAAKKIGISRQRLHNYEKGNNTAPDYLIARICLLYQIPIADLTNASEIFFQKMSSAA